MATLNDIKNAQKIIAPELIKTPLVYAYSLSQYCGCSIYLKLENLQTTGSFKARGALNKLSQLSPEQKIKGVIACSAGNHAQGVAYHAQHMKIPATIVMPKGTPAKKIENTLKYGAEVVLEGDTFAQAQEFCLKKAKQDNKTLIHPFDDEAIIAGQGTIGLEIYEDIQDFDSIVVPIGGGGLISGIATAMKALNKSTNIIGVQTEACPSFYNPFHHENAPFSDFSIAEGITVKHPAKRTQDYINRYVDNILSVTEEGIEQAIYDFINLEKLVTEGAAAASLAAVLEHKKIFKNKKVCLIVCGGNIDQSLLTTILTRGMIKEGLYTTLRFESEDRPGFLAKVSQALADLNLNIVEVKHDRLFKRLPIKHAHLDITIETRGKKHIESILSELSGKSFKVKVIK